MVTPTHGRSTRHAQRARIRAGSPDFGLGLAPGLERVYFSVRLLWGSSDERHHLGESRQRRDGGILPFCVADPEHASAIRRSAFHEPDTVLRPATFGRPSGRAA